MKKILILNGTISEIPIIQEAKAMGYYVITSGNMPELPGHRYADEYIPADYSNVEEILQLVKQNGIEGIVSCANDFGVITSSYVSELMNWPGHDTYENSVLMHHKDALMQYFKNHGMPTPWFEIFTDIEEAQKFCSFCTYPVIIKANDLTGGKGISKAANCAEAFRALSEAFYLSRDKHILIEQFLEGVQQSIVVFLVNKRIVITSSSDIYCIRNPYLVQAETYPASNFSLVKEKLHSIIHQMADDLHLADGILSFQYIVVNGVPYVIDMMRRCFGNETLLLADEMTGFPWERAYIMSSLGLDCSNIKSGVPTSKFCGHYGVMAKNNGTLKSYIIPDEIQQHLFKSTINMHYGDIIKNYQTEKIAHIYFKYNDFEQMKKEIEQYDVRIEVDVEP